MVLKKTDGWTDRQTEKEIEGWMNGCHFKFLVF